MGSHDNKRINVPAKTKQQYKERELYNDLDIRFRQAFFFII